MENGIDERNYKLLLRVNLCLAIGLGVVASSCISDLLYLRMHFNLTWFGWIRSSMFFVPALSYFVVAPLISGTHYSREIVQWSYLIRIGVATLCPLTALLTSNPFIRLVGVLLSTTICFVAAAFANNTLMILYRQLLPGDDFNRRNATISATLNIGASVVSLLAAGVISLANDFTDRNFYWLVFGLEAFTGIFELGVFRLNRKLKMRYQTVAVSRSATFSGRFRQAFIGLRSPEYRRFIVISATACFFASLIGTYIAPYLYTVHNASAFVVALIANGAVFGCGYGGIWLGKLCDHIGYLRFFRYGSFIVILMTWAFGCFGGHIWMLILFLLLIFDGTNGLLAGSMAILRGAAAAKLVPAVGGESYVALYSMVTMLSSFIGSIVSGWIYYFCQNATDGNVSQAFPLYFKLVTIAGILMLPPLFLKGCKFLNKT